MNDHDCCRCVCHYAAAELFADAEKRGVLLSAIEHFDVACTSARRDVELQVGRVDDPHGGRVAGSG